MDRVRLEPLERAELIDTLALQGLTYEHIRRAMGAQLGGSATGTARGRGGLLSAPIPTYDHTLGTLTLSSFSFLELTQGGAALSGGQTAAPEARLVRFDSADTDHPNHPIDISAARTAGTTYTLWARYVSVTTDLDARRKWSVALNAEVSATIATRERERVEFTITTGATPADAGASVWVQLLSYSVSAGGMFSIATYYHAHSAADEFARSAAGLDTAARLSVNDQLPLALFHSARAWGLIEHLAALRAQLYKILYKGDSDETTPDAGDKWSDAPARSLMALNQLLTDTASQVGVNQQTISYNYALFSALANDLTGQRDIIEVDYYIKLNISAGGVAVVTYTTTASRPVSGGLGLTFDYARNDTQPGRFDGSVAFTSKEAALFMFNYPVFTGNGIEISNAFISDFRANLVLDEAVYSSSMEGDETLRVERRDLPALPRYVDIPNFEMIDMSAAIRTDDTTTANIWGSTAYKWAPTTYTAAGGATTNTTGAKLRLRIGTPGVYWDDNAGEYIHTTTLTPLTGGGYALNIAVKFKLQQR